MYNAPLEGSNAPLDVSNAPLEESNEPSEVSNEPLELSNSRARSYIRVKVMRPTGMDLPSFMKCRLLLMLVGFLGLLSLSSAR